MADEIRASIKVDADVAAAEKKLADLQNELQRLINGLINVKHTADGTSIDALNFQVSKHGAESLVEEIKVLNKEYDGVFQKEIDEYTKLTDAISKTKAELDNLRKVQAEQEKLEKEQEKLRAKAAQEELRRKQAEQKKLQKEQEKIQKEQEKIQKEKEKLQLKREKEQEKLRAKASQEELRKAQAELRKAQAEKEKIQKELEKAQLKREKEQEKLQKEQEKLQLKHSINDTIGIDLDAARKSLFGSNRFVDPTADIIKPLSKSISDELSILSRTADDSKLVDFRNKLSDLFISGDLDLSGFRQAQEQIDALRSELSGLKEDVASWYTESRTPINELADQYTNLRRTLDYQGSAISSGLPVSPEAIESVNNQYKNFNDTLNMLRDKMSVEEFENASQKSNQLSNDIEALNTKYKELAENTGKAQNEVRYDREIAQLEQINNLNEQYKNLRKGLDFQGEALASGLPVSPEAIESVNNQYKNFNDTLNKLRENMSDDEFGNELQEVKQLTDDIEKLNTKYKELTENISNTQDEQKGSSDSWVDASEIPTKTQTTLSKLNGIKSEISALAGEAAIPLEIIKKTWDLFNESLDDTIDIASNIGSAIVSGIGIATEAISELVDLAEQAAMKLKDLADSGIDIQQGWFTLYNYLGSDGGSIVKDFATKLQDVYGIDADPLIGQMRGILGVVSNMNLELDKATDMTKALVMFGLDASKFSGESFENVVGQLESAISLGTLNARSPIVRALDMTKEDVKKFRELSTVQERANFILSKGEKVRGLYAKWLNTSAGRVEQLNNSLSRLQAAIQKLSTGVLGMFALQIKRCVDGLSQFIEMIAEVLNITVDTADLNFAGSFTPGNDVALTADEYDNLADSVTKAGKAYKEATPQAASFDDVIQLPDNVDTSDSLDDTVDSLKDLDIGDSLFNFENATTELTDFQKRVKDFVAELKDLISAGDFYGVGARLNEFLTDELKQINWDDIQNTVVGKIQGITDFINGFFGDKELFQEVGGFFAELINTFNLGVAEFFTKTNFVKIGEDIAASITSFWRKFDAKTFGKALGNVVLSAIKLAAGFVVEMLTPGSDGLNSFQEIGLKIAESINGFFESFSVEDMETAANAIFHFVDGIFQAIGTFIDNLDTEDIMHKLEAFIKKLFGNFSAGAENWGATLGKVVQFIIDTINMIIKNWDSSGMYEAIRTFINNAKFGELIETIAKVKFKIWWETLKAKVSMIVSSILTEVNNLILGIFGKLADFGRNLGYKAADLVEKLGNVFSSMGDTIKEVFWQCVDAVARCFSWLGSAIYDNFIAPVWNWLTGLRDKVTSVWDKITGFASDWKNFGSNWLSGAKSIFMASGGVVTKPVQAVVGEAGREVVLPLENNTGWMDILSAKIAVQVPQLANNGILKALADNKGIINNNTNIDPFSNNNGGWMDRLASKIGDNVNANRSSNSPIVIDTSQLNKMVYSRDEMVEMGGLIAEALNAYGVAVSVI